MKRERILAFVLSACFLLGILAGCGDKTPANSPANSPESSPPVSSPSNSPGSSAAGPSWPGLPRDGVKYTAPPAGAKLADEVRVIMGNTSIVVMDPFKPAGNNQEVKQIAMMLYDRLLNLADDNSLLPELAAKWDAGDYQTYSFTLRDDVYFHNGEKLTSSDVEWTIQQALAGAGSGAFDVWALVDSVKVIDALNFQIVLKAVNVNFLFNLARPMAAIVSKKAMTDDPENGAMYGASGAYKVNEFVSGDYIRLQRNDKWWNKANMPVTEFFLYKFFPEQAARALNVLNGEYHFSYGAPPEDVPSFESAPDKYAVYASVFNNPQSLVFNLTDPLMADKNFRLAVLHALDKEEIALIAAGKWAYPDSESGNLWGLYTEFRNPNIQPYKYDLELAKKYLKESSYAGQEVELVTAIITNVKAAEVIKSQLEDIGIKVRVNEMDMGGFAGYTKYGNTQAQMVLQSISMAVAAGTARSGFTPGGGQNRASYDNPEITALFDEADRTSDPIKRRDIYYKIQQIIMDDAIGTNVFWRVGNLVAQSKTGGMILPPYNERNDMRGMYFVLS